jgi:hypothetical protein
MQFTLNDFGRSKIAASGTTLETAAAEQLFSAPPILVKTLLRRNDFVGGGLVIPFGGKFVRVRLERPIGDTKYLQRARSAGRLYVPKTLAPGVLQDSTIRLYIAEGELKAIKMVQEGFPAVGVTGVYGWLYRKEPVPDFDRIAWEGRHVTIVFDSDPGERSRGQVRAAEQWLAAVLTVRGAEVDAIHLPDDGAEKVGVDDFMVRVGVEEFRGLTPEVVPVSSPYLIEAWS